MINKGIKKAIPYHASIRLRLSHFKELKTTDKELIGRIVKCEIKKNKVAPPMRTMYYTIHWGTDTGAWIDPAETMFDSAIRAGIFEKVNQQKFEFKPKNGDPIQFTRKTYNNLVQEDSFLTELKLALAESYVITRKNISSDDIVEEDASEED